MYVVGWPATVSTYSKYIRINFKGFQFILFIFILGLFGNISYHREIDPGSTTLNIETFGCDSYYCRHYDVHVCFKPTSSRTYFYS